MSFNNENNLIPRLPKFTCCTLFLEYRRSLSRIFYLKPVFWSVIVTKIAYECFSINGSTNFYDAECFFCFKFKFLAFSSNPEENNSS